MARAPLRAARWPTLLAFGCLTAAAAAWPPEGAQEPTPLTIRVLRVTSHSGGGDAILIADSTRSSARHVLVDAGENGSAAAALRFYGIESLDLLVLTHAHFDHYGGMEAVLASLPVRVFAFNGQVRAAATYRRLLQRVRDRVPTVVVVSSTRRVTLGAGGQATTLTLLPSLPDFLGETNRHERLNEGSLAVRVELGKFSLLTSGDAERRGNRHFVGGYPEEINVDVLKLGHHGSADATQPFWLEATSPDLAVISANGTTHPHRSVLALLRRRGIPVLCTAQHGTITLRVARDGHYNAFTERPDTVPCLPGSAR